jgi:hypothetical protein
VIALDHSSREGGKKRKKRKQGCEGLEGCSARECREEWARVAGREQSHSQLAFSFNISDQLAPPREILHHVIPPVPMVINLTICSCQLTGWTPSKIVKVHVSLPRLLVLDLEGKLDPLGEEVKLEFCEFDDTADNHEGMTWSTPSGQFLVDFRFTPRNKQFLGFTS